MLDNFSLSILLTRVTFTTGLTDRISMGSAVNFFTTMGKLADVQQTINSSPLNPCRIRGNGDPMVHHSFVLSGFRQTVSHELSSVGFMELQ